MIIIGRLYLNLFEGISSVKFIHQDRIASAFKDFHNGRHRLIFAFRHAAKEDPPVLMYAFNHPMRKRLRQGRKLSHVRFLYGRDVPNWAGGAAAWLFPKIGAIPVQNRGGNREALCLLRREMKDGRFPIILAPEEQVVYHMYHTSDIAPGISSLVRWGQKSGKPVMVMPLAMGYTYGEEPERFIRKMLSKWENETGFRLQHRKSGPLYPLLAEAADKTVSLLESFYGTAPMESTELPTPGELDARITALCAAVLSEAEKVANLSSEGSGMDRLFRIRYAGVDSLFPEKLDPAAQPALPRALLDFKALKAAVSIRHSQIVDVLEYIHMSYITPPFSAGRGCEFVLNLLDLINRAQGGDISSRFSPKNQKSVVLAGPPIVYDASSDEGMGRRESLDKITSDVKAALEQASAELEREWESIMLS